MVEKGSSEKGYIFTDLINPVEFYNVLMRNKDKFSPQDQFTILRFLDKLSDSQDFELICKSKLSSVHYTRKRIGFLAKAIYCPYPEEILLDGNCTLVPVIKGDEITWILKVSNIVIVDSLTPSEALKVCKDINYAFTLRKQRMDNK